MSILLQYEPTARCATTFLRYNNNNNNNAIFIVYNSSARTKTWRTVIAFRRPSCGSQRCDTRSNGVRRRTDSTTTPRSACVLRAGWSVPTSHTHTWIIYIYICIILFVCVCVWNGYWVLKRCSSPKTIPSMMGFFSFIPLNAAALCLNKIFFFCSHRRIIKIIRL